MSDIEIIPPKGKSHKSARPSLLGIAVLIAAIIVGVWLLGVIFRFAAWLLGGLLYIAAAVLIVGLIYWFISGKKPRI